MSKNKLEQMDIFGTGILDNTAQKNSNVSGNKKEYDDFQSKQAQENIENSKSDRELKRTTLYFVMGIISINIIASVFLIVANAVFIFKFDKTLYSEKFLGFLLGSQLIVMPFVLLKIITNHLFPNKDK